MNAIAYPAIDVRDGRVVRLQQGDYARERVYADDPLEVARRYADAGAQWLHLVDLDAARAGGYTLLPLLRALKAQTPLRVQTGGGVRSEADVDALLGAGADRVVVGSFAVQQRERVAAWLRDYGVERITLALDARQDGSGAWRLPVHGWTEDSGATLDGMLDGYRDAGLRHLLSTDIGRDGMLGGLNLDLYRHIRQSAPGVHVQASGGVRDLDDVRTAVALGCGGVVLGRALLEGRFLLADALAACAGTEVSPC